jgi:hypothetical protein
MSRLVAGRLLVQRMPDGLPRDEVTPPFAAVPMGDTDVPGDLTHWRVVLAGDNNDVGPEHLGKGTVKGSQPSVRGESPQLR